MPRGKKASKAVISYLDKPQMDALLAAPDRESNQHCRFDLGKVCNPLRYQVHPRARHTRLAMQDLKPLDVTERRRRTRFPIALVARYAVPGRREIEGTGRTVNISSHGVLITSAH